MIYPHPPTRESEHGTRLSASRAPANARLRARPGDPPRSCREPSAGARKFCQLVAVTPRPEEASTGLPCGKGTLREIQAMTPEERIALRTRLLREYPELRELVPRDERPRTPG